MRRCLFLALFLAISAAAQSVTVRILATTDLHGNIYPYDYFTAKPAPRGLAKIATLIAQERNPNTLLIDCGDTIQGATLETVHQQAVRKGTKDPDPMMLAMNKLGYDMMTLGNHEFNYGLKNLEAARQAAKFPWVSANIEGPAKFAPYFIKTVSGVRVAIVGITTETVPSWEKKENYAPLKFQSAVAVAKKTVAELRDSKKADVIVISAHTGLDRDTRTGVVHEQSLANEQVAYQIAESAGADAVIFGHTHSELASYKVGDVLMMQPRNWGMSLGEMDITVERDGASWKISSKKSRIIPVTDATAVDESILAIGKPYHEAAEKYLSQLVAESPAALSTAMSRVEDTALIDAIQMVQMDAAKADVSFASAFNLNVHAPKGKISVRELAALYLYDNTLYAIEGNGKMVREALENSARFYFNRDVFGYNYDMAEGVTYEVDPSRPPGSRILNLKYKGQPLKDDQPLRLAVNNYRAGGSAGYTMFPNAKVVWRSSLEIREMMIDYFTRVGKLPAAPTNNWKLVGDRADELISAARKNAGQPELQ